METAELGKIVEQVRRMEEVFQEKTPEEKNDAYSAHLPGMKNLTETLILATTIYGREEGKAVFQRTVPFGKRQRDYAEYLTSCNELEPIEFVRDAYIGDNNPIAVA